MDQPQSFTPNPFDPFGILPPRTDDTGVADNNIFVPPPPQDQDILNNDPNQQNSFPPPPFNHNEQDGYPPPPFDPNEQNTVPSPVLNSNEQNSNIPNTREVEPERKPLTIEERLMQRYVGTIYNQTEFTGLKVDLYDTLDINNSDKAHKYMGIKFMNTDEFGPIRSYVVNKGWDVYFYTEENYGGKRVEAKGPIKVPKIPKSDDKYLSLVTRKQNSPLENRRIPQDPISFKENNNTNYQFQIWCILIVIALIIIIFLLFREKKPNRQRGATRTRYNQFY